MQGWSYASYSSTNQMWHVKPFSGAGFLIKAISDKKGDCQATRPIDQEKKN